MSEEWGPWIEHDGKGCPCKGEMVEIIRRSGERIGPYIAYTMIRGFPVRGRADSDNWVHLPKPGDVIRYRVRKPKGLTILNAILREVEREKETV